MMKSRYNLKPCPFCGGKAYMWQTNYQTFIQCEHYDAKAHGRHLIQVSGESEESATEAWNRRIEK